MFISLSFVEVINQSLIFNIYAWMKFSYSHIIIENKWDGKHLSFKKQSSAIFLTRQGITFHAKILIIRNSTSQVHSVLLR